MPWVGSWAAGTDVRVAVRDHDTHFPHHTVPYTHTHCTHGHTSTTARAADSTTGGDPDWHSSTVHMRWFPCAASGGEVRDTSPLGFMSCHTARGAILPSPPSLPPPDA